jgi:hypothetical protein
MHLRLHTVLLLAASLAPAAEVFEANLGRESELPKGKEADGIRGDFVLRNDLIEAVVSQNAHNRRANMSTFYGPDGVTPGCLFDLTLRGANNDQLICFGPVGHGPVSYVKIVATKDKTEAAVESVTTAAKNGGVFHRDEYRVRDGVQGVFVTSILRNESDKPQKVSMKSDFTRFEKHGDVEGGIYYADAVDPADKAGYAKVSLKVEGTSNSGDSVTIQPGKEVVLQRFIAVGTSPAQAVGLCLEARGEKVGIVEGTLLDKGGKPVTSGAVMVPYGKVSLPAYPDAKGDFRFFMKPGKAKLSAEDRGREPVVHDVEITADGKLNLPVRMAPACRVTFDITDAQGRSLPCKAMFKPADETVKLDLGPKMRAHGCVDQYHSEKGQFTVQLPAGAYTVRVVRGGEYSSIEKQITLAPGAEAVIKGQLQRVIDSPGWITTDFHNHSTQSGDNICGTDDRIINLAAENLEWCPTTEHNRLYDWAPHIARLGLTPWMNTVTGMELTGSRQHFNCFPLTPEPFKQDNGAPEWNDDPRITALTLRRHQGEIATRWIQFNHPDLSNMFIDRNSDGTQDGGFVGVGDMIDGSETQNGNETAILAEAPVKVTRAPGSLAAKASPVREFVWRQLLNQGLRVTPVAVADAHAIYGNGVAGWHNYLQSPSDDPAKLNWDDLSPHAKAGHVICTNGPFLRVTTPDGKGPGDDTRATGSIDLKVQVQCTDWIDIDRVQVLVNSRPEAKLNFTRATHPDMFKAGVIKFDHTITVPLQHDAHLIIVAMGESSTLVGGYGTSDQAKMMPCAYNAPIYVDTDGHGFTPNGDTLGYELPGSGLKADEARKFLSRGTGDAEQPTVKPALVK